MLIKLPSLNLVKIFRKNYENSFTLSKSTFTSLSRPDKECVEDKNYNWGTCLDELFYENKGN